MGIVLLYSNRNDTAMKSYLGVHKSVSEIKDMEDTVTRDMEDTEIKDMEIKDMEIKDMEIKADMETRDTEIKHIIPTSSTQIQQLAETAPDSVPEAPDRRVSAPQEWPLLAHRTVEVPFHPEMVSPHLIRSEGTTQVELAIANRSGNRL